MHPTAVDFFDSKTHDWRARTAISLELLKDLSLQTKPREMEHLFATRLNQLFPTDRQLTITRVGLKKPFYRTTRFNLLSQLADDPRIPALFRRQQPIDPWRDLERFPIHHGGILAELLYSEQPKMIDHLSFETDDPANLYLQGQHSLLALPLYDSGEVKTMLLLSRKEAEAFLPQQIPDLLWLCNLFARTMQSTILSEALSKSYSEVEYELKAVAELQHFLLPANVPTVLGLDIAKEYRTAERAGGDLYEFIELPDNKLGVLIADVCGHGSRAAMMVAILQSLIQEHRKSACEPGKFLTILNEKLTAKFNAASGSFITAFYVVIDHTNHKICYASAGHVPGRLIQMSRKKALPLNKAQRLPLGVNPQSLNAGRIQNKERLSEQTQEHTEYECWAEFHPGDMITLLTDGWIEARNKDGELFGIERIDELLFKASGDSQSIIGLLRDVYDIFMNGEKLQDDQTILIIQSTAN